MGGLVKKLAALVIGGVLLAAVPAVAAPVKDGFLSIRGPDTLSTSDTLRIPIRCAVDCKTKARTVLKLPGDDIPPSIAQAHLEAGKPKNLVVQLNQNAIDEIQGTPGGSRLRVSVFAKNSATGDRVHAVKVFEFAGGTPAPPPAPAP
jgi:hypothetical protein